MIIFQSLLKETKGVYNLYQNKMADRKIVGLVDDHQILIDGISALLRLENNLDVRVTFTSGESLLAYEVINELDILVMDINMKGKDGIQTLADLKDTKFRGKVILLTTYDDLKLVNEAFELGAKGYVTKGNAADHLVDAIEKVCNGESYYSPDIKEKIVHAFTNVNVKDKTNQEDGLLRQLTSREREVLQLIAMQYTSDEIAKKLFVAKSTVDTHRKNLIFKLNVKNAVGLGLVAERHGLI